MTTLLILLALVATECRITEKCDTVRCPDLGNFAVFPGDRFFSVDSHTYVIRNCRPETTLVDSGVIGVKAMAIRVIQESCFPTFDGRPVGSAKIRLTCQEYPAHIIQAADSAGLAWFDLWPGTYTVMVSKFNLRSRVDGIVIDENTPDSAAFTVMVRDGGYSRVGKPSVKPLDSAEISDIREMLREWRVEKCYDSAYWRDMRAGLWPYYDRLRDSCRCVYNGGGK